MYLLEANQDWDWSAELRNGAELSEAGTWAGSVAVMIASRSGLRGETVAEIGSAAAGGSTVLGSPVRSSSVRNSWVFNSGVRNSGVRNSSVFNSGVFVSATLAGAGSGDGS